MNIPLYEYMSFLCFQDGLAEILKIKLTKIDRFKQVEKLWIDGERNFANDDWKWRHHIQYFSGMITLLMYT